MSRDLQQLYRWRVRAVLPERFGHLCHVLVWGQRRAVLIEFEDGARFVTRGNYLRKVTA